MRRIPPVPPTPAEVRAELDRILATPAFRENKQLASTLRRLTEQALAAPETPLHEEVSPVAVDPLIAPFPVPAGLPPQDEEVSRAELDSLRRLLEAYYSHGGGQAGVLIEFPEGSRTPVFFHFSEEDAVHPPTRAMKALAREAGSAERRGLRWPILILVGITLLMVLLVVLSFRQPRTRFAVLISHPVTISTAALEISPPALDFASAFH